MNECKIAGRLSQLRKAKGLTQEDVAKILSVSNKTVSKWETGTSEPDLSTVVTLANYYGISTDVLLGTARGEPCDIREVVLHEFQGLDRAEMILKAFELVRSVIPAVLPAVGGDGARDCAEGLPPRGEGYYRDCIATQSFFDFDVSSDNVNVAVMLLRNRADFAWLRDAGTQQRLAEFFRLLSDTDALTVIHYIHSAACPGCFTVDHITRNTGVGQPKAEMILDSLCAVGCCSRQAVHLAGGMAAVYESEGNGIMLSVIALVYEWTCGDQTYDYRCVRSCKMIGTGV